MRTLVLILALLVFNWVATRGPSGRETFSMTTSSAMNRGDRDANPRVDFERQIKPIFQSNCMPCHFNGGKMYERLPFDRPETIKTLGEKLFTRIKEERHRQLIRGFLAQSPE